MGVTKKTSERQLAYAKAYLDKLESIKVRVPEGHRDIYKQYAASQNSSLNALIIKLLNQDMVAHGFDPPASGEPLSKKD